MKYTKFIPLIIILLISGSLNSSDKNFDVETFIIPSEDGVELNAEFYKTKCSEKPLILLFHQAGYSRGEYREIAPKLNKLGFCCLAIDQRSGNVVNDVTNEAYKQAKIKGLKTDHISALPDLKATLDYVIKNNYTSKGVILLGSSYSASLIFILASGETEQIKGLIAFSPGEYFKYNGKKISDYAMDISCPVFITSAHTEKENWNAIYDNISSQKKYFLPDFEGHHGAKALWSKNEGNDKYWDALKSFLNQY